MSVDTTKYSERVKGDRGNFEQAVRFDVTRGYVGITQLDIDGVTVNDRVLLSPAQFKALVSFAGK